MVMPLCQQQDELVSSSSDDADNVDGDAEGWEDVDGDEEPELFISLFDDHKFHGIVAMFEYCKAKYNFDIWDIQRKHDLDFLGLVRLCNFMRRSVSQGSAIPDLSSASSFEDDFYLLPAMESDAVLYNLEDILVQARTAAKTQVEELQEQMDALQARFDAYKEDVSRYLGDKFENIANGTKHLESLPSATSTEHHQNGIDADYFHSYSFNDIHETMLKDRVRTDAYRDFIYDNKDIFRDKIVLDVGCGTGILSMFCARAGAKQVIAVDNSNIIHTAREIIKVNQLENKISCVKGKIEEVKLPVDQVDIIVSEWMGYCLLYESMLDSVIYARDRYLAPNGLMVPSHASLNVGVMADSDLRDFHMYFWKDVYGFDMSCMIGQTQDECLIKIVDASDLTGKTAVFRMFDLHKVTVQDLTFRADFAIPTSEASQRLDGFVLWFDIFFTRSCTDPLKDLENGDAKKHNITAFSTGPYGDSTHWQQGICLTKPSNVILAGKTVQGKVAFQKMIKDTRALSIEVQFQVEGSQLQKQSWHIK